MTVIPAMVSLLSALGIIALLCGEARRCPAVLLSGYLLSLALGLYGLLLAIWTVL